MTSIQYRSIMAVLWLIAAHLDTNPGTAIACAAFFLAHSVGALVATFDRKKGKVGG